MSIRTILVVDDDTTTTSAMQRVLEPLGYAVTTATGGWDAIRSLHREAVDLVITDILMPDGDGFELIGALRKSFSSTRIIAISAGAGSTSLTADTFLLIARGMRADGILRKPISRDELVLAIKAAENRGTGL
jgi:two-component system cell cycle response regulator CpdR